MCFLYSLCADPPFQKADPCIEACITVLYCILEQQRDFSYVAVASLSLQKCFCSA